MNPSAARQAGRAVRVAHGALLATVLLWQWSSSGIALAVLAAIPLVAPAYGLWTGRRFTHVWATLCVMPYLVLGVMESIANPPSRPWAGSSLALALALFVALVHYLRVTRPAPHPSGSS